MQSHFESQNEKKNESIGSDEFRSKEWKKEIEQNGELAVDK